ncbi:MAG: hypothetical protein ACXQS2_00190 [Methermicoccaceae archaeon]
MDRKVAILWDTSSLLERYISERVPTILLNPVTLLPPFGPNRNMKPEAIIIPTGFGNLRYSKLGNYLGTLSKWLIKNVRGGSKLLVFGAMYTGELTFLPGSPLYLYDYGARELHKTDNPLTTIVTDDVAECDGYLELPNGWDTLITDGRGKVLMAKQDVGEGVIILTTLHDTPSDDFLKLLLHGNSLDN